MSDIVQKLWGFCHTLREKYQVAKNYHYGR